MLRLLLHDLLVLNKVLWLSAIAYKSHNTFLSLLYRCTSTPTFPPLFTQVFVSMYNIYILFSHFKFWSLEVSALLLKLNIFDIDHQSFCPHLPHQLLPDYCSVFWKCLQKGSREYRLNFFMFKAIICSFYFWEQFRWVLGHTFFLWASYRCCFTIV